MINKKLCDLLEKYSVDMDFSSEIKKGYRNPLEDTITSYIGEKTHFRYGGSLAKGTANINSCDMDLLSYVGSDSSYSVEDLYNNIADSLVKDNFIIEKKSSAICVTGRLGEKPWEISVDVVPGKYTSNENNKDVFLWCNKDCKRLKSNPEIQIGKVKNSNQKDLIRLIKLYRTTKNFKLKSFYLEIFILDYVSQFFKEGESLYERAIKFAECYEKIGNITLVDPANSANDITKIHSEWEFSIIRSRIKELYDALMTYDWNTIKSCLLGGDVNISEGYQNSAKAHSNFKTQNSSLLLKCQRFLEGKDFWCYVESGEVLSKNIKLKFSLSIPKSIPVKSCELIVSNGGFDAIVRNECPRGDKVHTQTQSTFDHRVFFREENTAYYGEHLVQAVVTTTSGYFLYSNIFVVKIA